MRNFYLRASVLFTCLSAGWAQGFSSSALNIGQIATVVAQSTSSISASQPPPVNTLIVSPPPLSPPQPLLPAQLPEGYARTASGKPIPCSPKSTRLNPSTHKLISECVETSFCWAPPGSPVNATGLGVCIPRRCRRDEFPFGYGTYGGGTGGRSKVKGSMVQLANGTGVELPPLCANGAFCPDNGSGCQLQVLVGERCELARDEQCAPPPPNAEVAEKDNRATCLMMTCTYVFPIFLSICTTVQHIVNNFRPATLPLNAPCTFENTTYISDINRGAAGGGQMTTFVVRHNCLAPGLFCDPTPPDAKGPTCQPTKKLGEKCRFDAECEMVCS